MKRVCPSACSGLVATAWLLSVLCASEAFAAGKVLSFTIYKYDEVVPVDGFGDCVQTTVIRRTGAHDDPNAVTITTKTRTDGAGRVLESEDAEGRITAMTYDAGGNRLSIRDPNGVGQDCVYDDRGRDISCTDTQGDNTLTAYNLASQPVTKTDAKGKTDTCKYDPRGRKIECTNRVGSVTKWRHDQIGNLERLEDGEAQQTDYVYDTRNLKTQTTWPNHLAGSTPGQPGYGIETCEYDAAGRKTVCTDQQGDTKTQVYDMANRVLEQQYVAAAGSPNLPDSGMHDVFTYDGASRLLTAMSNRYNNVVTLGYDNAGRVTSEQLTASGQSYTINHQYDAANRRTQTEYPDDSVVKRVFTNRDQLEAIDYTPSGGSAANVLDCAYDIGMRETSRTHGNGLVTTRQYNRSDNYVTDIDVAGKPGLSFDYSYDANKNPTSETTGGVMASYSWTTSGGGTPAYDDEDRLTYWERTAGAIRTMEWQQSAGQGLSLEGDWDNVKLNGTLQTRTHGAAHELTAIGAAALTHDVKGNTTTNTNGDTYTYDFDNCMNTATVGSQIHEYAYDALGRRVSKTVDSTGTPTTTVFVCASQPFEYSPHAGQVLGEYAAGQPSSNPAQKYVYATYIDEPVLKLDASETKHYYHTNRLFKVTALTDSSGNVAERYSYTAYGETTIHGPDAGGPALGSVLVTSAVANPYGYTGRRFDDETGLQYSRARYYDAPLARFTSRDPILYVAGLNVYQYVRNNPERFVDPLGLTEFNSCLQRSNYYCAAAAEHPENSWLKCACNVSYLICLGANANAIPGTHAGRKASWLYCMNECMFKKWLSGYQATYPDSPLPEQSGLELDEPTEEWAWAAKCLKDGDICDGSKKGRKCCKSQVRAEQSGLTQCMEECGAYDTANWGNPFDHAMLPELARLLQERFWIGIEFPRFEGDFNDEQRRFDYGYNVCDCD